MASYGSQPIPAGYNTTKLPNWWEPVDDKGFIVALVSSCTLFLIGWILIIAKTYQLSYARQLGNRTEGECGKEIFEAETARHKVYKALEKLDGIDTATFIILLLSMFAAAAGIVIRMASAAYTGINTSYYRNILLFGSIILTWVGALIGFISVRSMDKYGGTAERKNINTSISTIGSVFVVGSLVFAGFNKDRPGELGILAGVFAFVMIMQLVYSHLVINMQTAKTNYDTTKNAFIKVLNDGNAAFCKDLQQNYSVVENKEVKTECDMKTLYPYIQHKNGKEPAAFAGHMRNFRNTNSHVGVSESMSKFAYSVSWIMAIILAYVAFMKFHAISAFKTDYALIYMMGSLIFVASMYAWISGNLLL